MMTFTSKCLFILLCSLLPCVASAGLFDRLLFLLPRVAPGGDLIRQGGTLARLFEERRIHRNSNSRRAFPFPVSLESHIFGFDPFFYYLVEDGTSSSTESTRETETASGNNSGGERNRKLAQTAGVVETVAEIHARNYDAFINLDRVPSALAEESPEAQVALVINNIIRRRGWDDSGLVSLEVYKSVIEEFQESPSDLIDGLDNIEDVD